MRYGSWAWYKKLRFVVMASQWPVVHWSNQVCGLVMLLNVRWATWSEIQWGAAYIHKAEHLESQRRLIAVAMVGPIFLMRTGRRVSVRLNTQMLTIRWEGDRRLFPHMLFPMGKKATYSNKFLFFIPADSNLQSPFPLNSHLAFGVKFDREGTISAGSLKCGFRHNVNWLTIWEL